MVSFDTELISWSLYRDRVCASLIFRNSVLVLVTYLLLFVVPWINWFYPGPNLIVVFLGDAYIFLQRDFAGRAGSRFWCCLGAGGSMTNFFIINWRRSLVSWCCLSCFSERSSTFLSSNINLFSYAAWVAADPLTSMLELPIGPLTIVAGCWVYSWIWSSYWSYFINKCVLIWGSPFSFCSLFYTLIDSFLLNLLGFYIYIVLDLLNLLELEFLRLGNAWSKPSHRSSSLGFKVKFCFKVLDFSDGEDGGYSFTFWLLESLDNLISFGI